MEFYAFIAWLVGLTVLAFVGVAVNIIWGPEVEVLEDENGNPIYCDFADRGMF